MSHALTPTLEHCDACPVAAGLTCYHEPGICARAARPGEERFRATLVRHAEGRARQARRSTLLDPAEAARLRAAETCPDRDCVGCGWLCPPIRPRTEMDRAVRELGRRTLALPNEIHPAQR